MKHWLVVACMFLVVGCADSYNLVPDGKYDHAGLLSEGSAYIALPADGQYGDIRYSGSGAMVAKSLQASLIDYMTQVDIGRTRENYAAALKSAQLNGYTYLFFPTITHWEDRATEWSCLPDRIEVKLVVIDTLFTEKVSSATIEGTSGLFTFGGDHPQDLLADPVDAYVKQLF